MAGGVDIPYRLTRIGTVMSPDPGQPWEAEGVLNPAAGYTPDGRLHLLPRLVAAGNVSRIGLAEVVIDDGVPTRVQRRGIVLSPDEGWEHGANHGGVEDPRVTFVERLGVHIMTYVAFGPLGPRIALATSRDLLGWERLGPVLFAYQPGLDIDLNLYPNKDAVIFPEPVPGPGGVPSYAMLHRPMWDQTMSGLDAAATQLPAGLTDDRPGIWISYVARRTRRGRHPSPRPHARPPLCRPARTSLRARQDRRRSAADTGPGGLAPHPSRRARRRGTRLRPVPAALPRLQRRGDAARPG